MVIQTKLESTYPVPSSEGGRPRHGTHLIILDCPVMRNHQQQSPSLFPDRPELSKLSLSSFDRNDPARLILDFLGTLGSLSIYFFS